MTRVLLVTGARSLANDLDAEAWARGLIAEALVGVDLLIVGDAPGPDAWAWEIAGNLVVSCDEYLTRGPHAGMISEHRGIGASRIGRPWSYEDPPRDTPAERGRARWAAWLLSRNAAMVRALNSSGPRHTVSVLALLDGRKPAVVQPGEKRPTRGTEHTARLARDAGLTVDAQTWPKGATT